jgi:uncharacterized membrane protein YidH (DUF202 family)
MSHTGRLIVLAWTLTALVIVLASFVTLLFALWSQPATTSGADPTREFYAVMSVGVAFDVALVLVVAFVTRRRNSDGRRGRPVTRVDIDRPS